MGRTYQVISGDGHLEIPPEPWIRHVPEEHRDRAPRLVPLREGGHGWIVEGSPLIHNGQNVTAGRPVKVAPDAVRAVPTSGYPTPAARPLNSRLDCARLRQAFGLHLPPWQAGVERMLVELLGQ